MVPGALRSTRVLSVACGETHTLCVASGGLAYAFGSGEGVLGIFEGCSRVDEPTVVPATRLEPVDRVFAGRRTSAAITARGTALMWGSDGGTGRLALGPAMIGAVAHVPTSVPVLDHLGAGLRVVHIALGEVFSAFLVGPGLDASDGNAALYVAGALGVSPSEYEARREALSWAHTTGTLGARAVVSSLSAGRAHLAIVADGSVYTMGRGWLGGGSQGHDVTDEPVALAELDADVIVEVACGDSHTLARTDDGRIYSWGDNAAGQLGLGAGQYVDQRKPQPAAALDVAYHASRIFAGADFSAAVSAPGAAARRVQIEAARAASAAAAAAGAPAALAAAGGGGADGKLRRSKSLLVKRQSWRSKAAADGASPGSPAFAAQSSDLAAFFAAMQVAAPAAAAPAAPGAGTGSAAELAAQLARPLPAGWSAFYDDGACARPCVAPSPPSPPPPPQQQQQQPDSRPPDALARLAAPAVPSPPRSEPAHLLRERGGRDDMGPPGAAGCARRVSDLGVALSEASCRAWKRAAARLPTACPKAACCRRRRPHRGPLLLLLLLFLRRARHRRTRRRTGPRPRRRGRRPRGRRRAPRPARRPQ